MNPRLFPFFQYLDYYLRKEDRHALQSPFVYKLYQGLKSYYANNKDKFPHLEKRRQSLLTDKSKILVEDMGAGSLKFASQEREISAIARYSCSSQKYALLYQYFCSLTPANTVVELGTCLGINSCYLAEATLGQLYTFEGASGIINYIKKDLAKHQKINLVAGDISKTLPTFLRNKKAIDFAFLDANHTYEHTLSYFEQLRKQVHHESIIVIGDIRWSRGMKRAWEEIIALEQVRLSLDFYECGVLIFREGLAKSHYILHY